MWEVGVWGGRKEVNFLCKQHEAQDFTTNMFISILSRKCQMLKINSDKEKALEVILQIYMSCWNIPKNLRRKPFYAFIDYSQAFDTEGAEAMKCSRRNECAATTVLMHTLDSEQESMTRIELWRKSMVSHRQRC